MNQSLRKICLKIQAQEELDTALPQYLNQLINIYGQYSNLNFSMLYYTFYENYQEAEEKSLEEEQLLDRFNGVVKDFLSGEFLGIKMQEGIKNLDDLRNIVINRMHILTSYTDFLETYEYVLNRIEYRFESDLVTPEQEQELVKEIVTYIFNSQDNVVINDKIKEVIGQLPIRLTKAKYFDMLRDALSIYKGGDFSSLETFLYMIRTSSMLYKVEGIDEAYPELVKIKQYFQSLNFTELSQAEFTKATNELNKTVTWILEKVDFYFSLEECINQLYVMLLTHPYQFVEGGYKIENLTGSMKFLLMPEEMDKFRIISKTINSYFLAGNKPEIEETLEDLITFTEGKQEDLFEEMNQMEGYFSDISFNHKDLIESLMLGPIYHSADMAGKLLGGSIFIDVKGEKQERITTEEDIKKANEELVGELSTLFSNNQKMVIRAVMANTMSKLPVFFNDSNEIEEYIKNSLASCGDLPEKTASYHIIKSFFEN
ncbi:MAG: hypothetical protein K0S61_176 [Anaerocolumna sp.]|jgi:hypothetical protein|nr:hypothetical protein [Anaerocolumna sp.]